MPNPETPTNPEPSPELPAHAVPDPNNPGSHIVSGEMQPIHGPTFLRNVARVGEQSEPGSPAQAGKSTARAAGVSLFLPRFVSAPRTKVFDHERTVVDAMTYEKANDAAREIVAWSGDPDDVENSQRLRTMAKVYIADDTAPPHLVEQAHATASEIVMMSHEMPITPASCTALTLAYATVSRSNEKRDGNKTP